MTVSYQYDVASSASGGFIRLLFRWKGSVWKVVYREMLLFTVCYIMLTILYNFILTETQQRIFEKVVFFCSTFMDLIPLSFMLGFYVSFIAARWWSQFIAIPWPDKLMNIVAMYIPGLDESSRVVRRTLMRYLNLSLVLVLRSISMAVKRRFPTKEHLIEAGFMTKTELEMFQSVPSTEFNTFWIPCTWFINVLREARQECRITDSNGLKLIMEELNEFRSKCGLLWGYDWISIPLVYTQVVTMATYAFFVACMFGRQNVNIISDKPSSPEVHRYDYYVPIFTILQLMFYMGLLKVAEQLINPFGDDDEDFELNWIIDRHMKVSYLGVDTLNGTPPPLVKDTYYDELDVKIPYTEASKGYKKKTYRGSVAYMQVPMEQQHMVVPDMSEEEDDGETTTDNMGIRRPSMYSLFQSRGSNCKGMSPATSFTNLDNRSITSLDSEWKRSLPDLSTLGAKNASGTLGCSQAPSTVVDLVSAEEDEIVLQEVIVEQDNIPIPTVTRSDSLQIPGTSTCIPEKKETSMLRRFRGLSPKIAPKFPREKLKSMFRKRKLSSALPFHKLKGVRFSRGTKDEDESENESLLNVDHECVEVSITLSTPELTEIEKETGVHPYYYTQQALVSAKQLATGRAFTVRQASLTRSESEEDKISKCLKVGKYIPRSRSLPNIQLSDSIEPYIHDPIIASSLKKISKVKKPKEKTSKFKRRRKSPPLESDTFSDEHTSDTEQQELDSDSSRRNTLPQITLTRYDLKAPEHLDLAISPTNSSQSSSQSCDSAPQTIATNVTEISSAKDASHQSKPADITVSTDESTTAKSSGLFSKQKKETSQPSKPHETVLSKDEAEKNVQVKDKKEEPPEIPPRMPTLDIKASSGKITSSQETPEMHSKPKKTSTQHSKVETPAVSKDEEIKPTQLRTMKQESSKPSTSVPLSEDVDKTATTAQVSELHSKPTTAGVPISEAIDKKAATVQVSELHSKPTKTTLHPSFHEPPASKEASGRKTQAKRKSPPPPRRISPPPPRRISPPPPKRPETLTLPTSLLAKRGSVSSKKIAGISLAATPISPTTDIPSTSKVRRSPSFPKPTLKLSDPQSSTSSPSSPPADIPSPVQVGQTPSFSKPAIKPSHSPKRSPTTEGPISIAQVSKGKGDTVVKLYDSQEDLQGIKEQESSASVRPPDAPKRHLPRQTSRVKK